MTLTTPTTATETTTGSADGATAVEGKSQRRAKLMVQGKAKSKASTGGATSNPNKAAGKPARASETKASIVLKKLKSPKGVTIDTLMEATGWQAHSVRGFLSAVVKKKLGLNLVSEIGKDGVRRYRIDDAAKPK